MYSVVALVAATLCAAPAHASVDHDSTAIVATIDRFHAALASGDSADVKNLLSSDVIVLESGSLETRADYFSHHLAADIEFAKAIHSERKVVKVVRNGNTAWVTATSTTKGDFKGRAINSRGAELMVLTKTRGAWRIRAIHWSSARIAG
jgi:ketosteroid isomerase-like protein